MTGYGQSKVQKPKFDVNVAVKSVNGRFLEIRMHAPKEYAAFESEIKKQISAEIKRGTVDVYVHRRLAAEAVESKITTKTALAQKWLASYRKLAKDLKLPAEVDFELIASQPDIFTLEESQSVSTDEKKQALAVVKKAAAACGAERVREGKSLLKDLTTQIKTLEGLVSEVQKLRNKANKELETKLKERWKSLQYPGELDPQRLAQEIVVQIDKADVSEEITRLKEHTRAMRELMKSKNPQGKKLDFYSQELLREVNTIGSKSQIAKLTRLVVDAKSVIERIREQVQNVE